MMKRIGTILGAVVLLIMAFAGTASAQDGQQPLPAGAQRLFISHIEKSNELVPGFYRYQGACDAQGNCPGHSGFHTTSDFSAWSLGDRFETTPGGSVFYPARRMKDGGTPEVTMFVVCIEPNCMPGITFPNVQSAQVQANSDLRYLEYRDPPTSPMPEDEFVRKLTKWIKEVQPMQAEDSMVPANFPIQQITFAGLVPLCDRQTTPASEGAQTVAHFRIAGVVMCWNGSKNVPGIILRWTGRDWSTDQDFVNRMVWKWAYVISFSDFYHAKSQVQFSESFGSVYDSIAQTPVDEWQIPVPDWGSIGVAAGGVLGAAGAGVSIWVGTRAVPALSTAVNSVWLFVIPESAVCPTYDMHDDKPPLVLCNVVGVNQ